MKFVLERRPNECFDWGVFRTRLRHKIQIVIGTPGRINDVIDNHENSLQLRHIKMVVLDEVDVMLQMGFLNQVWLFVDIADYTGFLLIDVLVGKTPKLKLKEKPSNSPEKYW